MGETNYDKGEGWYQEHFAHCANKKVIGEFTPIYLHSPEVPERIHKHFPEVKLIAILRNPIERIYSHYMYTQLKGFYKLPSFEEVMEKERCFIEESSYYRHLQNYLKYFPREQILITFYEDIEKDPETFIKQILKFIGADETFVPPSTHTTINPAGAVALRNKLLSIKDKIRSIPGGTLVTELLKRTPLHKKLTDSLATKTGTIKTGYGKINPETRRRLSEFYKEDTENLEKLLGRDLTSWKR